MSNSTPNLGMNSFGVPQFLSPLPERSGGVGGPTAVWAAVSCLQYELVLLALRIADLLPCLLCDGLLCDCLFFFFCCRLPRRMRIVDNKVQPHVLGMVVNILEERPGNMKVARIEGRRPDLGREQLAPLPPIGVHGSVATSSSSGTGSSGAGSGSAGGCDAAGGKLMPASSGLTCIRGGSAVGCGVAASGWWRPQIFSYPPPHQDEPSKGWGCKLARSVRSVVALSLSG